MSPRSIKPVIFLGFANDKEGKGFLRGLTKERNGIRQALRKLQEAGICEVVTEPDLSINRLFEVFQQYPDRIAAFHYGGHADSFELLLESQSGEKERANSEGLISFLGKQKGLELVFLNGCSSGKQADSLVEEGVPAVIGTSEKINDQIATGLAINFYQGLAKGRELQQAWEEAIDQANTRAIPGATRSLNWDDEEDEEDQEVINDDFAWHLKTSSQHADAVNWSLPKAANNPLFGLGLGESYLKTFPKSPYPGLRPFKSEEARIFFGRGAEIRELYNLCQQDKPVILLHGQAGVGKTSLVQAGLIPRSEHSFSFVPAAEAATLPLSIRQALENHGKALGLGPIAPDRVETDRSKESALQKAIDEAEGYVKTFLSAELERIQAQSSRDGSLVSYWLEIEKTTQKPLIVWVDHLENFEGWSTSHVPQADIQEGLRLIKEVFTESGVKGKLLLSYREPFHGQIQAALQLSETPFHAIDLAPLDYDGIVEAVEGVVDRPALQTHFRLQIERSEGNYLPQIIADDLREDSDSPLTPILQVVLSGLWKSAKKQDQSQPYFTVAQYQNFKQSGKLISSFVQNRIPKINAWRPDILESGLMLDFLFFHTEVMGHSKKIPWEQVEAHYQDRKDLMGELWERCQDLYILAVDEQNQSRLFHDYLAPVVISEYTVSLRPGQQASRILSAKMEDYKNPEKEVWLDGPDLSIVEQGLLGMQALDEDQRGLIELSRKKKAIRDAEKKRNRQIRLGLAAFILLFAVLAVWEWREAEKNFKASRSSELAYIALEEYDNDPTRAMRVAAEAYAILKDRSGPVVTQALTELFHEQDSVPFYRSKFPHLRNVASVDFSPDHQYVLTASGDKTAKLWKLDGKLVLELHHPKALLNAHFSANGNQILTLSADSIRLFDRTGRLLDRRPAPAIPMAEQLEEYSTDGIHLIPQYIPREKPFYQWLDSLERPPSRILVSPNLQSVLVLSRDYHQPIWWCPAFTDSLPDSLLSNVSAAAYSPEGNYFATARLNSTQESSFIQIWQQGKEVQKFSVQGEVRDLALGPNASQILVASALYQAKLWDFSALPYRQILHQGLSINGVGFDPKGNFLVTGDYGGSLYLWDRDGQLRDSLINRSPISNLLVSPDGSKIVTRSPDGNARIWEPGLPTAKTLAHESEVTQILFSPSGSLILTRDLRPKAYLWDVEGHPLDTFEMEQSILDMAFSPDEKQVALASADSSLGLFSIGSQTPPTRILHPNEVSTVAFSPDGKKLFTTIQGINMAPDTIPSQALLWDLKGKLLARIPHEEPINGACFDPTYKRMYTWGKQVWVWNEKGEALDSLYHGTSVYKLAFDPSDRHLMSISYDNHISLWHRNDYDLKAEYVSKKYISAAAFAPDGLHILVGLSDGRSVLWWTPESIHEWIQNTPVYQLSEEDRGYFGLND